LKTMADAPPLYGDDAAEIEGVNADEYAGIANQRKEDRKKREVAEDSRKDDVKPKFIQPQKEKRFKIYMKYEGRKGPPAWIKSRLPKHGGFEDGPASAIKKMFCNFYNKNREMLSQHSVHLRSETGIVSLTRMPSVATSATAASCTSWTVPRQGSRRRMCPTFGARTAGAIPRATLRVRS